MIGSQGWGRFHTSIMAARRRLWLVGVLLVVGAVVAVPVGIAAHFMIGQAVGRTTVVENADGSERTVYWREYPGTAGLDPQEVLEGPTPEEGYAAGQNMVAEIRKALTKELQLKWAPAPSGQNNAESFTDRTQNYFGGESLLTAVNAPASHSTSVPRAWTDKQRAIKIIGAVTARHGYSPPTLDSYDLWSEEQRISDLGGATPETQVILSGSVHGPAGQWLMFTFQDLSKDTEGRFEERLRPPDGSDWQPNTLRIGYGANGLLREADREEFRRRLEPFAGMEAPAPLET